MIFFEDLLKIQTYFSTGEEHRQCVRISEDDASENGIAVEISPPENALTQSCGRMGENKDTLLLLKDETCAMTFDEDVVDQKTCRPDTICCDGFCRGLPTVNRDSDGESGTKCAEGKS